RFADGYETDVTALAKFQSNHDGMAYVSEDGVVTTGTVPGAVAVMASYLDVVDTFRALVPRPEKVTFPNLPETKVLDRPINARLRTLNILPSEPADDATFLRRVYLDVL